MVPKKLVQDVVTRWNSTFYTIERFIDLEVSLRSTVALLDATLPTLTMEEWSVLKELCKILRPFETATCSVSDENYLSASLVIVVTNGLLDVCSELVNIANLSDTSKIAINKLENGLRERLGNVEYSNILAMCTFLDARFKTFGFKNADAVERVRKNVISAVVGIIGNEEEKSKTVEEPDEENVATNEKESTFSIWYSIDKAVTGCQKYTENITAKALMEVQQYMEDDLLERRKDPLQWWRDYNYMYPNLSKLVRQKCCALGTSVPCKRLFSKAGNLLNE
ncbi:hypothetical protein NQ314_011983 [Rhamnusium bicolor]|uniref:HAT C-terminal dimerisation domain-containing protein n=1 Tax=Rhamnusium bicolor TaxID=1586634 RepID=A0AAV8XF34_9CUCU|nr:hypothetical protein NQ314_011983 [Rhamnusium bicolor]